MKTIILFLLGVAILVCQIAVAEKTEKTGQSVLQKIKVAYTTQPQSTLIHVAMAKGYFAEEGLSIEPLILNFGKEALQTVLDNKADLATAAETPIMFSIFKGEKIFIIANIEESTKNNAVVARVDSGISEPLNLKGKRVGYTPGTTSEFFLDSFLTANGLTRKDIKPVGLKPDEMQEAIQSKKVDAVSTWNYPLTQIKNQLGANAKLFYDHEIYTETFNLVAKQDFVKKNPETIKSFLRAVIKAETFVVNQPEEAQAILVLPLKKDKSLIRDVWNDFGYQVILDQTILITLIDEARWAIKNKFTNKTEIPEFMSYIHFESLMAVKPTAVKMKR